LPALFGVPFASVVLVAKVRDGAQTQQRGHHDRDYDDFLFHLLAPYIL
jgi:hypothetical protein